MLLEFLISSIQERYLLFIIIINTLFILKMNVICIDDLYT